MRDIEQYISNELFKKKIDLDSFGINEYAWNPEDIMMVLKELENRKIGVLGGDVYNSAENIIEMTFDSWYINDDNSTDYYNKSIKKAYEYISEYEKRNNGRFIYSLVVQDCV